MRVQGQPILPGADFAVAARYRAGRIEAPSEQRALGDVLAGERPDQQPVPGRHLERIGGGEETGNTVELCQGQRRGEYEARANPAREPRHGARTPVETRE